SRSPACSSTQARRPISKVRCATGSHGPNGNPARTSASGPAALRTIGSLLSIATMAAVSPISIGVRGLSLIWRRLASSVDLDAERTALDHHAARTHLVERAQHPSVASEHPVGEADDQPVGLSDRR